MSEGAHKEVGFDFEVPPQLDPGVYANTLGIWNAPYEFTLDWAVMQPPRPDPEAPDAAVVITCNVAARMKPFVPKGVSLAFRWGYIPSPPHPPVSHRPRRHNRVSYRVIVRRPAKAEGEQRRSSDP